MVLTVFRTIHPHDHVRSQLALATHRRPTSRHAMGLGLKMLAGMLRKLFALKKLYAVIRLLAVMLNKLIVQFYNLAVMLNKLIVQFYNLAVKDPLVMLKPDRRNLVVNDGEDRPHYAEKSEDHICHHRELSHRCPHRLAVLVSALLLIAVIQEILCTKKQ